MLYANPLPAPNLNAISPTKSRPPKKDSNISSYICVLKGTLERIFFPNPNLALI